MESMTPSHSASNCDALACALTALTAYVERSARQGGAAHEVEAAIWQRVVQRGRHALGLWFRLVGPGDRGEPVLLPDGHAGRRRETPQARVYQAVLGRFELERVVDGTRAGQKMAYVPCDRQ